MGRLINGEWHDQWYDTGKSGGKFVREDAGFRNWIRADGSTRFAPEAGRYHLYVSWACPWAHRALIVRALKRLDDVIDVSVVHWLMRENGWTFLEEDGATGDRLHGKDFLYELYAMAVPDYTGRVTVPLLWDRKTESIVSNESADIIRMLNREFGKLADTSVDLYPDALGEEIDEINAYVYERINNGVYKCGFATTQAAYDAAFDRLFEGLDAIDARLEGRDWLAGGQMTEADIRLFTTLLRFDSVYYTHFKCNRRRIRDYANLSRLAQRLFAMPAIATTVNMHHIKHHYFVSHDRINPTGIVPRGPERFF